MDGFSVKAWRKRTFESNQLQVKFALGITGFGTEDPGLAYLKSLAQNHRIITKFNEENFGLIKNVGILVQSKRESKNAKTEMVIVMELPKSYLSELHLLSRHFIILLWSILSFSSLGWSASESV